MSSRGGIELNKVVGAVLLAGVIAMVSGFIAEGLYTGTIAEEKPQAKRGYTIPGAESATSSLTVAAPKQEKPVDILPYLAKANVQKGEAESKQCAACHTFTKGGANGVGPNQWGLVGNTWAHDSSYSYSQAIGSEHGKKKWDFQTLSDFLTNPMHYVPGTKMPFAGIQDPQARADLIAWLNQQSDHPLPLPKGK